MGCQGHGFRRRAIRPIAIVAAAGGWLRRRRQRFLRVGRPTDPSGDLAGGGRYVVADVDERDRREGHVRRSPSRPWYDYQDTLGVGC